jgi:AAA+ ATPase superfamily predicted ATPase
MFIDREPELAFLDSLLARQHPGPAQLVLLYGRRRVGKTALLRHWAAQSGLDYTHVAVEKEPAPLQRRKLHARLLDVPSQAGAHFASWSDLWAAVATFLGERRHILILDELPYAAESDPAVLTALQHAWDQHFQGSRVTLVLCGSHVHTMETLMAHGSPLFGRLTGQWELGPLPFGSLRTFLSGWSAAERVAAYAMVGGVPAYLEWLDPRHSLSDNIRNVMLRPGSMFVAEPSFLLYDEVRDPRTYLAILGAIGAGHHTLRDISNACLIGSSHLSAYLSTLQDLRLVRARGAITYGMPTSASIFASWRPIRTWRRSSRNACCGRCRTAYAHLSVRRPSKTSPGSGSPGKAKPPCCRFGPRVSGATGAGASRSTSWASIGRSARSCSVNASGANRWWGAR